MGAGFGGTSSCSLSLSLSSLGGVTKLGLTKFEAKIGQRNEPSIRMFQKLHFKQVRTSVAWGQVCQHLWLLTQQAALWLTQVAVSSIFQEVTLRLTVSRLERQWLLEQTSYMEERPYRDGSSEPHCVSGSTRPEPCTGL